MSAVTAIKTIDRMADIKAAKTVTRTGKVVDLSKGYTVRGPDGTAIPFKADTPLEKAKVWTKNFYASKFETVATETAEKGERNSFALQLPGDPRNRLAYFEDADAYQIMRSNLTDENKGKGIGAGMYRMLFEKAKKEGRLVKSDQNLTDDSKAIWERFKQLGYPVEQQGTGYVYNPGNIQEPAILRKQAGAAPGDEDVETTGALLKPQASAAPAGLVAAGTINTDKRKTLKNEDGTVSTELSFSIGTEEGEVLIPQVVNGKKLSKKEAIEHYKKTGEHLGIFDTPEHADAYAKKLHEKQGEKYGGSKKQKVEPGLYFDEDSKQYVQVGEDGSIKPAKIDEAR